MILRYLEFRSTCIYTEFYFLKVYLFNPYSVNVSWVTTVSQNTSVTTKHTKIVLLLILLSYIIFHIVIFFHFILKTKPNLEEIDVIFTPSVLAQKVLKDLLMITWQVLANLEVKFSPDFNLQLSIFQEDMSKFQNLFGG